MRLLLRLYSIERSWHWHCMVRNLHHVLPPRFQPRTPQKYARIFGRKYMHHKTTWWPHLVSDHIIDYNYISSVYELSYRTAADNGISKHNYNSHQYLRPIWGARPHARTCHGHQLWGHQKQLRPQYGENWMCLTMTFTFFMSPHGFFIGCKLMYSIWQSELLRS